MPVLPQQKGLPWCVYLPEIFAGAGTTTAEVLIQTTITGASLSALLSGRALSRPSSHLDHYINKFIFFLNLLYFP